MERKLEKMKIQVANARDLEESGTWFEGIKDG